MILDPDQFSVDGSIVLSIHRFSEDGKLLAYCKSKRGSQWNILKVRNVETLKDCPEELHFVRHSRISWHHENKGFFYSVGIEHFFCLTNILNIVG